MTIQQVRDSYDAKRFEPFIMHLADGREIPVRSREFMMAAPNGRTIIVYEPDSSFNVIDLVLVTDLEAKPANNSARRRKS